MKTKQNKTWEEIAGICAELYTRGFAECQFGGKVQSDDNGLTASHRSTEELIGLIKQEILSVIEEVRTSEVGVIDGIGEWRARYIGIKKLNTKLDEIKKRYE